LIFAHILCNYFGEYKIDKTPITVGQQEYVSFPTSPLPINMSDLQGHFGYTFFDKQQSKRHTDKKYIVIGWLQYTSHDPNVVENKRAKHVKKTFWHKNPCSKCLTFGPI